VALFCDTFHEVNGAALTCRQLVAFARRRGYPLFNLRGGTATRVFEDGSITVHELRRGFFSFHLGAGLSADPFLLRYRAQVRESLQRFQPDLIHFISLGDCGTMAALLAHEMGVPTVASWHTNVHEFAAWRLRSMLGFLPKVWKNGVSGAVERKILALTLRFYGTSRLIFAPNPELIGMIEQGAGKSVLPMQRGIDLELYSPAKRRRTDDAFVLGYVGRLAAEKNVRFLAKLEQGLLARGFSNFRFLVVGPGGEREWLEANLRHAELPGVLQGEALAEAYANMDLFIFPSHTDTFGNVILEALASGTPPVVTASGGPKFLVRHGVTGMVGENDEAFIDSVSRLMQDRQRHEAMRRAAREDAHNYSWDAVFERVYEQYRGVAAGTVGELPPQNGGRVSDAALPAQYGGLSLETRGHHVPDR
jgi:glycosyltransferase involved in cell wall biosynthesis